MDKMDNLSGMKVNVLKPSKLLGNPPRDLSFEKIFTDHMLFHTGLRIGSNVTKQIYMIPMLGNLCRSPIPSPPVPAL
ncbi:hypothetical protein P5673_002336 [Acropora cervicornis]|uniref:Uncharacterized protein n=1 Tax=Acropora cervicornis TaxID=6130 RepID=A0AAD9R309_ACRCE|nr:hypothetical protein P5673_002336 [Acropora cervicornis]